MYGETFHYKVYSFMFMLITHNGLILRPEYVCVFDQAGAQNGCTTGYVSLGKGWGGGGWLWAETKLGSTRSIPSHLED